MNNKTIHLSAVVIAKNEESRIAKCLESLSFCDEIIVIDNGSTDKTAVIAGKFHTRLFSVSETDFSKLRNVGKDMAGGKWILYVDADEIVPANLQHEITRIIEDESPDSNKPSAYFISRENYYLGKKWPVRDKMQRLFLKKKLICWKGILHETAHIDGVMGDLQEPLIHDTHRTLVEMVNKTNEWSGYEAQLRFDAHHPKIVWWRFLRVMMTGFNQSYFKEGGWRAGTVGWIESIYQAFSIFITYAKLWEMQQLRENKE